MKTQPPQQHSIRPLIQLIDKDPNDFQRKDLLKIIQTEKIKQLNLHYTGMDGKLKEVKIPINHYDYADMILAQGERLDGSSVFKGIIDASHSDLYIVPIYKTAFLSPFENNTMGIMCRFLDSNGDLALFAPDNILLNAHKSLTEKTGYTLNALGEIEFYVIYDKKDSLFSGLEQRAYHQAAPFVKTGDMINEILDVTAGLTGSVKYAHSEVGYIEALKSTDPELNGKCCEQYEVEFLPRPVEDMAYFMTLAKWVIRNIAYQYKCGVTFTPKLEEGYAGNGLHFHLELAKNGKNMMVTKDGQLSDDCKKMIGGLCHHAPSLTAFGNTVSSAYLRLVPNQEAPTKISWSENNRSALIRVPLGWRQTGDMAKKINLAEQDCFDNTKTNRQTIEFRSPDGSAHINLLLAGMTIATQEGLLSAKSLERAEKYYVTKNIFKENDTTEITDLSTLPASCDESAESLLKDRAFYEQDNLFPEKIIDYCYKKLKKENDQNINERFAELTADKRLKATREIMHKDLHKH
ncbi:MAG: glutamine synthetase family protein [bacterium]|nr:glutamine synthetase family protein [bacterium]MBU1918422.1 glutamine synthetase family protein [bacterium]